VVVWSGVVTLAVALAAPFSLWTFKLPWQAVFPTITNNTRGRVL